MIINSLKLIYDFNKKNNTFLFRLVKNTKILSMLSKLHKFNRFRVHIKESTHEISRLNEYLKDDISRQVLKMIVNARTNNMYKSTYYSLVSQPQYFIDEVMASLDRYTLIDAGAYTGDTLESFIKSVGENYEEIFCFEPDSKNLDLLHSFISKENIKRIRVVNKGLYSKTQTLGFAHGNSSSSKIDPNLITTIEVVSLDDYFGNVEVVNPLLKMDIEGAEPEALIGAENFINKYRPSMAICIYHEPEHLFDIPFYIKEKHPFYELLMRHHSNDWTESVLYCLPRKS